MNTSHHTAIEEYKNGNFQPLTQLLRNKFKNDPELRDFLVLIVQRKVKLKPGKKAGMNEKRDRQLAARMRELKQTKYHWDAIQALKDETGLSEGTIQRAYRKYATARKARPHS